MSEEGTRLFDSLPEASKKIYLKGLGVIPSVSGTGALSNEIARIEANRAAQKPHRNRSEGDVKATVRAFFTWLRSSGQGLALNDLIAAMDNEDASDEVVYGHDGILKTPLRVFEIDRVREVVTFKPSFPDAKEKKTPILFSTLGQYLSEIHNE